MSQNILTEYLVFLNHQIASQEILLEYHLKAEAMLKMVLNSNLPSYSVSTIYHYLWSLSDIITQAKTLNEVLLNTLVGAMLTKPPKGSSGNGSLH